MSSGISGIRPNGIFSTVDGNLSSVFHHISSDLQINTGKSGVLLGNSLFNVGGVVEFALSNCSCTCTSSKCFLCYCYRAANNPVDCLSFISCEGLISKSLILCSICPISGGTNQFKGDRIAIVGHAVNKAVQVKRACCGIASYLSPQSAICLNGRNDSINDIRSSIILHSATVNCF